MMMDSSVTINSRDKKKIIKLYIPKVELDSIVIIIISMGTILWVDFKSISICFLSELTGYYSLNEIKSVYS